MAIIFHLVDTSGQIVLSNLTGQYRVLLDGCTHSNELISCPVLRVPRRRGIVVDEFGRTFVSSTNETKSSRLFKEQLRVYHTFLIDLRGRRAEYVRQESIHVARLVHGVEPPNGKALQEIYDFISEDDLTSNAEKQIDVVMRAVNQSPWKAAHVIQALLRLSLQTKRELDIYQFSRIAKPTLHGFNS